VHVPLEIGHLPLQIGALALDSFQLVALGAQPLFARLLRLLLRARAGRRCG
jgi:hypothetical protein